MSKTSYQEAHDAACNAIRAIHYMNFTPEAAQVFLEELTGTLSAIANLTTMPEREYVVIESDWPEYEPVWKMLEARVTAERAPAVPDAARPEPVAEVYMGFEGASRCRLIEDGGPSVPLPVGTKLYTHAAAPAVPQGWKLVPVEPTPEMLASSGMMANYNCHAPGASPDYDHVEWYRAMLSAAPTQE